MVKEEASNMQEFKNITPKIIEQILEIRNSGETNMFDTSTVASIAKREGFRELTNYLKEHGQEYFHFILKGKRN